MNTSDFFKLTNEIIEAIVNLINSIHNLQLLMGQGNPVFYQQLNQVEYTLIYLLDWVDQLHQILFFILFMPTIKNCSNEL